MEQIYQTQQNSLQQQTLQSAADIELYSPAYQVTIAIRENRSEVPWTNKQQHAFAWELLAHVLSYPGGWEELEAQTMREEKGKPYLPDSSAQFNISHCCWAVAVICAPFPVGIDIERKISYKENLARRISHPKEWEILTSLPEGMEKAELLSRLWSRKESLLKAMGEGLAVDTRKVLVLEKKLKEEADWTVSACPDDYKAGYTFYEKINTNWTCCAALHKNPSRLPQHIRLTQAW